MKQCKKCGHDKFSAHMVCYSDVTVNGNNDFEKDEGCYESEKPYGPYVCKKCGAEYETFNELEECGDSPVAEYKDGISAKVDELEAKINMLTLRQSELNNRKNDILSELPKIETELTLTKKEFAHEMESFVNQYMLERFGVTDRRDANMAYLVFDAMAQFVKVYRKQDFEYVVPDMETVLNKEKLYAHSASSWYSRSRDFYNLSLMEQLKILSWTFDAAGKITGANW